MKSFKEDLEPYSEHTHTHGNLLPVHNAYKLSQNLQYRSFLVKPVEYAVFLNEV